MRQGHWFSRSSLRRSAAASLCSCRAASCVSPVCKQHVAPRARRTGLLLQRGNVLAALPGGGSRRGRCVLCAVGRHSNGGNALRGTRLQNAEKEHFAENGLMVTLGVNLRIMLGRVLARIARPRMYSVRVTYAYAADGREQTVSGEVGADLMRLAHATGVELEGACEGALACSTCHVVLPPDVYSRLPEPGDEENDMLDLAFGLTSTYAVRICCSADTQVAPGVPGEAGRKHGRDARHDSLCDAQHGRGRLQAQAALVGCVRFRAVCLRGIECRFYSCARVVWCGAVSHRLMLLHIKRCPMRAHAD